MTSNPSGAHRVEPDPAGAPPDQYEDTTTGASGRVEVLNRQKDRFGGIRWGAALFGWLTATGAVLVLTAIAAATGTALALSNGGTDQLTQQAGQAVNNPGTASTVGIIGAIVVLVVVLVAYLCGGYVAGRMARFNGIRQGLAVWLWTIVIAVVVAIVTAIAGSKFNILASLRGLPRIPIDEGTLTTAGIVTALIALAAALIGALLGGLAGMRYHRRIDRTGFTD
jgi:hypothetical protein